NLSQRETSEIALIENIQREDLNPIEEASAYKILMEEYGLTQEELSKRVGKSRPFIANTVRLLALPEHVKDMVLKDLISAGHARALLTLARQKEQEDLAKRIALVGMSVRQTEKAVQEMLTHRPKPQRKTAKEDPVLLDLEERLKRKFSTKVIIRHGGKNGRIEIEYYGDEELQRLLEALLGKVDI
ncbi:MAG: ParB/RepB/Spo0J family partition protein, partial [Eubacteriales bacterium]